MLITVIAGVLVYVLSQIFDEYILKPVHRFTLLKSTISYSLAYYGNLHKNPLSSSKGADEKQVNDYQIASVELRKVAAELKGFIEERPTLAFLLPSGDKMMKAFHGLIGLSNSLFSANQGEWLRNTLGYEADVISNLSLHKEE